MNNPEYKHIHNQRPPTPSFSQSPPMHENFISNQPTAFNNYAHQSIKAAPMRSQSPLRVNPSNNYEMNYSSNTLPRANKPQQKASGFIVTPDQLVRPVKPKDDNP